MAAVLLLAGLAIASLPALGRPVGRRIRPAEWATLCIVALVGGAVAVEAGALLIAAPTVLRAAGAPALAQACNRLVGPLLPLGTLGGWVMAGLAVVIPALAIHGWRRARTQVESMAIEPCLGRHEPRRDYELVVLPTAEPLAYSVTHPARQVVVSQGLADALTPAQLQAVIAHERAHLHLGHPDILLVSAAAQRSLAFWPPAARSHAVLRTAVERWADDAATGTDPGRRRALRDALVAATVPDLAAPVAAFSVAHSIIERVEAMDRQPRAPLTLHLLLYVPGTAGAIASLAAAGGWASQARDLLVMAGRCTI